MIMMINSLRLLVWFSFLFSLNFLVYISLSLNLKQSNQSLVEIQNNPFLCIFPSSPQSVYASSSLFFIVFASYFCNGFSHSLVLPSLLAFQSWFDTLPVLSSTRRMQSLLKYISSFFPFFSFKKFLFLSYILLHTCCREPLDHLLFNSSISFLEYFVILFGMPCLILLCAHTPSGSKIMQ